MAKVVIRYYGRGNVGTTEVSNEMTELAEEVKRIYEEKGYDEAIAYLENYNFGVGWGFEVNEEEESITIYNRKIELDEFGGIRCSWGYEEAKVYVDYTLEELREAEKTIINALQKDKKYEVVELDKSNYAIGCTADMLNIEEDDELNYEQTVEFIKNIFLYLEDAFADKAPGEQAVPICSNNPYAWDEPDWGYEIENGGRKIIIYTIFQELVGAHYHTFRECVVLERIDE
jgi:uncharacterized protein YuzB (UPF0349 family)